MLPALSWLAPATVPHADANIPAPRTAKIVSTRLNSRSPSRSFIETSRNRFIETKRDRVCIYNTCVFIFYRNQNVDVFGKYLYGESCDDCGNNFQLGWRRAGQCIRRCWRAPEDRGPRGWHLLPKRRTRNPPAVVPPEPCPDRFAMPTLTMRCRVSSATRRCVGLNYATVRIY